MKKCLVFMALACLISMGSFCQNSPAEKYVKTFSETKNRWLIEKKVDSIKNMLDGRCLFMHSNGWTQNAEELVKDLESKKLVYDKIKVTESLARQFDDMVILTGKGRFEGNVDGKAFNMQLMYTEVYVKRKSGWKLASRQSTRLD